MASSRRSLLAAALILLPLVLAAQPRGSAPLVLSGRLLRLHGRDTSVVAGAWVVAHNVGQVRQGPIDSMRTDALGAFRFVVLAPDTASVYVVSARHDGIGYFSDPVSPHSPPAAITLAVFDTSSGGPPLTVGMRNIVITRGPAGGHKVLDIYQITNPGVTTRMGADTVSPTWSAALPANAEQPLPGESDIPASAIRFTAGHVSVLAPFPPGDKQVVFSYTIAAGVNAFDVVVDQAAAQVEMLIEDSTAQVSGPLTAAEPLPIEGHVFRRFTADSVRTGATIGVRFGAGGQARNWTVLIAILAALALAGGAAFAILRRPAAPRSGAGAATVSADDSPDDESQERLVAQLAALDDRFSGREAGTAPATWARYQARRDELKAALARRLARG